MRGRIRNWAAAVAGAALALALAGPVAAGREYAGSGATALARHFSLHAIRDNRSWKRYDEAPARALVRPVRVLQVSGHVSNPGALADPGSGVATTLDYAPGGTAPSMILDYGKDVGGIPVFEVASTSGTAIQTGYSETLRNLGNDQAVSVAAFQSGTSQRSDLFTVTGPGVVAASLIQGGERYERVTLATPGRVTLRGAGINFSPLRETPATMGGHFLSSEDLLNRIWYAGAYTLNLNQLTPGTTVEQGAVNRLHLLLDGAKRDRAVWSGDHMISDLADYYVSDPAYARDSIALFLEHPATTAGEAVVATGAMSQPGPLPGACTPNPNVMSNGCVTWSATYSMAVMPALYNYYLYTGDLRFVRAHWQAVVRQMQWDAQQVDSNGLFSVGAVDSADWNVENVTGELTYANALYALALQSASKLALAAGQGAQAKAWSTKAIAIKAAVNRQLWNARTGVYDPSTTQRGSFVQDANVTAILAGIPPLSRSREILKVLRRALRSPFGPLDVSTPAPSGYTQDVSPYMGSFNVLADFAAGDQAGALSLIRQEWGYMVGHDPGGVDWERIQLNGIPAGGALADSSAHAWSTGPTAAMSQYVLGTVPATAGYRNWTVAPEPGELRWAQGVVPTPHGPITVRWRRSGTGLFVLTVAAPRGTSGVVEVPVLGRDRTIFRNGTIVWSHGGPPRGVRARRAGRAVAFAQGAGSSTYAWAG